MFEEIIKKLNNIFFNNEKNLKNIVDDFNQYCYMMILNELNS
jgi:hypothetical protein